jgi:lysozyme family protein
VIAIVPHYIAPAGAIDAGRPWWFVSEGEWEGLEMLTQEMRDDYTRRFGSCAVNPKSKAEVESIVTRIMKHRDRYETVSRATQVPWFVVAVIHNMECSGRFDQHLHNGNPLSARTTDVPAGRPLAGEPPFAWEESAIDALRYDGFDVWREWTIAGTLFKLELYNGLGSRNHGVATPYLWGGSQHYTAGKYIRDHVWSQSAVSTQIGAAVLLRRMVDQALIDLPAEVGREAKCEGLH